MEALSTAIGVSRPTLSRYFQDAGSVRRSTRERIERGLERVDYVPNFFATRMNRKSTELIGVIVPYYNDLFFTNLLGAIETAAFEAGYTIIAQSSHGDPGVEARASDMLRSMGVDGVIVAPLGRSTSVAALERLSADLPLVLVDSRIPEASFGVDFVGTDNRQSMQLIVDYLCRTGPSPVFLGMPAVNSNAGERETAYRERMHALGQPAETVGGGVPSGSWDFEAYARDVMDAHFARGVHCDSTILCANDRLAIGVISAAHRHGLLGRKEDDGASLRVAGHDDHPLSAFVTPALTTVAQDTRKIGRTVVSRLLERIRAGRPSSSSDAIETHCEAVLKVRGSA
mgnify:CR=1 FL=1